MAFFLSDKLLLHCLVTCHSAFHNIVVGAIKISSAKHHSHSCCNWEKCHLALWLCLDATTTRPYHLLSLSYRCYCHLLLLSWALPVLGCLEVRTWQHTRFLYPHMQLMAYANKQRAHTANKNTRACMFPLWDCNTFWARVAGCAMVNKNGKQRLPTYTTRKQVIFGS